MRLALANLGAIFAHLVRCFTKMFDAINCYGVIGRKAANHDCDDARLIGTRHQHTTECTCGFIGIETCSHKVLHADKVCSLFAVTRQSVVVQSDFCAACFAIWILQVANFVGDYSCQFAGCAMKQTDKICGNVNRVCAAIRVCIEFIFCRDFDFKVWHCILLNAIWRTLQGHGGIVYKVLQFGQILRGTQWREKQQGYESAQHNSARFLGRAAIYPLTDGLSMVRGCAA